MTGIEKRPAEAGRVGRLLRQAGGYLLIIGWSLFMAILTDVISGGRTYPAAGGPDAFSRFVGSAYLGCLFLWVYRDWRASRAEDGP